MITYNRLDFKKKICCYFLLNYYVGILERNSQLCTFLRRIVDTRKIRSHSCPLYVRPVSYEYINISNLKEIQTIFIDKSINYQVSNSLFSLYQSGFHRGVQIQPWMITIVAGELQLWQPTSTGQRRGVEKIHVHPNFNSITLENDITILTVLIFLQIYQRSINFVHLTNVRFPAQNSVQIDT